MIYYHLSKKRKAQRIHKAQLEKKSTIKLILLSKVMFSFLKGINNYPSLHQIGFFTFDIGTQC